MYLLYSFLLAAAAVAAFPYFLAQGLRHGKYLGSARARLGRVPPEARSQGDAIWLHAVSVGEVLACQRLVAGLKQRLAGRPLVVSTTTETGLRTARQRLKAEAFFHCPFDFSFAVRRVLRQVRPALLLVAETELWPNLFREAWRAGVPVAVVNARVSDRSWPRYRRFRFFFRDVLGCASLLLAQSEEDARRLRELGAKADRVQSPGNLKYDQEEAPPLPGWLDEQVRAWAAAGALVAGSTAAGEEEHVIEAFQRLGRRQPGLRLVLAPRRPERFDEVAAMAAGRGLAVARRSAMEPAGAPAAGQAQALLLDTVGELRAFYRYATVAFVGGSLVPHGGQNILEPAQFARPVVVGPHMFNFREMTRAFREAGALCQVGSPAELAPALEELFADEAARNAMGEAARRLLESSRGATDRAIEAIAALLESSQVSVVGFQCDKLKTEN
jgi:3-deoxy-D-manno-octulosonic-acid transferase